MYFYDDVATEYIFLIHILIGTYPEEYSGALRNPLKGFRPDTGRNISRSRYVTLARHYIKWNDLEKRNTDDLVANIRAYSERKWAKFRGTGVKVIRVYLDWDRESGNEYWPSDLKSGDYSSPEFKRRVLRLVRAMGEWGIATQGWLGFRWESSVFVRASQPSSKFRNARTLGISF